MLGWYMPCGLVGPEAGVLAEDECEEGKLAGWKRGSDGSFRALLCCWRCCWPFDGLRGCIER